jgi:uroporphyrinogen-III synthase
VAKDIELERKTLNLFDGGCQLPLGVYVDKEKVYAAYKPNTTSQLKRLSVSRKLTSPEQLVNILKREINKKVFISRNPEDAQLFTKILNAFGCDVVAESFITCKAIASNLPDTQPDWLFFTSRNSVTFGKHVLESYPNVKIGAIGQSTARSILSLGYSCEFIGDDQLSTDEIGQVFSNLAKGNVFFVEASNGNKTIQKHNQGNYSSYSIAVYETQKRIVERKPEADIYAFTSPSNVKSFIEQYGLPEGNVFAIGTKTGETLKKFGLSGVVVTDSHAIHNLADCIAGMS